ncbi:GntR family transcriptional regulator [Bradyrhizobium sp. AUGA SZCCT0222]|nr:GntR family transcriptional regulator [Bradyrhizobium sp. AUGA SZCCT0222]
MPSVNKAKKSISKHPARTNRSITDATYLKLRNLIESRQLQPGEVIEERRLALRLKVSRTPLRKSLHVRHQCHHFMPLCA